MDKTIYETMRNAGEIEIVFDRRLSDRLKVILMIDNGGWSMDPYVDVVQTLFNYARSQFKDLKIYFFHNTIYAPSGWIPSGTKARSRSTNSPKDPETRLIIVGDASMAPYELMHMSGGPILYVDQQPTGASIDRMKFLSAGLLRQAVGLQPRPPGTHGIDDLDHRYCPAGLPHVRADTGWAGGGGRGALSRKTRVSGKGIGYRGEKAVNRLAEREIPLSSPFAKGVNEGIFFCLVACPNSNPNRQLIMRNGLCFMSVSPGGTSLYSSTNSSQILDSSSCRAARRSSGSFDASPSMSCKKNFPVVSHLIGGGCLAFAEDREEGPGLFGRDCRKARLQSEPPAGPERKQEMEAGQVFMLGSTSRPIGIVFVRASMNPSSAINLMRALLAPVISSAPAKSR